MTRWSSDAVAAIDETTPAGPAPRVLIVEDSPDHQALIRRTLERSGILCETVATGEEALRSLDGADIVLIDQGLPRMSGIELLDRISAMSDGPSAVVVTAHDSPEVLLGALRGGAVDFVAKDATYLARLPAVVHRAYRHHDARRRNLELQRLALLVHQPRAREGALAEIVVGARRLLRASGCLLARRAADGSWEVTAVAGAVEPLTARLRGRRDAPEDWSLPDGVLAMTLPTRADELEGVLLAERSEAFLPEEEALGRTFAAFAASALRHVRQHEIERGLIDELQRTMRVRSDFVASVSHELRTPLTAIGGYAETLLERWGRLDEGLARDLIRRIQERATHLEELIFQLLDVAELERGGGFEPKLDRVDLPAVLSEITTEAQALLGREITLSCPPDVAVHADREFLQRCLVNLLNNAAKFSRPDTPIAVVVGADRDEATITVTDRGIGLDAADRARVFEPFWRAAYSVAQAVRGTGVGLALVREYAQSMGGRVGVDSEPGVGSSFWITVPLAIS